MAFMAPEAFAELLDLGDLLWGHWGEAAIESSPFIDLTDPSLYYPGALAGTLIGSKRIGALLMDHPKKRKLNEKDSLRNMASYVNPRYKKPINLRPRRPYRYDGAPGVVNENIVTLTGQLVCSENQATYGSQALFTRTHLNGLLSSQRYMNESGVVTAAMAGLSNDSKGENVVLQYKGYQSYKLSNQQGYSSKITAWEVSCKTDGDTLPETLVAEGIADKYYNVTTNNNSVQNSVEDSQIFFDKFKVHKKYEIILHPGESSSLRINQSNYKNYNWQTEEAPEGVTAPDYLAGHTRFMLFRIQGLVGGTWTDGIPPVLTTGYTPAYCHIIIDRKIYYRIRNTLLLRTCILGQLELGSANEQVHAALEKHDDADMKADDAP